MLKVNIILYMNHVIHHIETPPGLTPPRLLAGGWEGRFSMLIVNIMLYMNHVIHHVESQYLELRRTKMGAGGVQNILFWDRAPSRVPN